LIATTGFGLTVTFTVADGVPELPQASTGVTFIVPVPGVVHVTFTLFVVLIGVGVPPVIVQIYVDAFAGAAVVYVFTSLTQELNGPVTGLETGNAFTVKVV
jgi:hypothetical protein